MISRTFAIEYRQASSRTEILTFKVEVYRLRVFGITIWKRECLH
mgnify:CR=1 FL=1